MRFNVRAFNVRIPPGRAEYGSALPILWVLVNGSQRWLYVDADAFNPYLWAGLEDDLPWFFGEGEEDVDADAWWGAEPPPAVEAWWLALARAFQAALAALASSEGWRQGAVLVSLLLRAAHELGIPPASQADERLREALHAWQDTEEGGGARS